ncbi:hypothetical protein VTI74DRAFT_11021 [Chaetomium olivicolor]
MAAVSRQPFAPLDGARLKSLESIKNRQNAFTTSPGKRKASDVTDSEDDAENVEPVLFAKRSKGDDLWGDLNKGFTKPAPTFVLTKAASSQAVREVLSPARPRSILKPKSPTARLNVKSAAPAPRTAPAGRSPPRASKRIGILSRRRTTNPPSFSLSGASVPFSLDAALKGTIPSYSGSLCSSSTARRSTSRKSSSRTSDWSVGLFGSDSSSSWSFEIHEDTPEQEMTNLLQHGTCTLDISSDEESESRASRERAEGRDKENIPPPEDVSQTSSARSSARAAAAAAADDFDDVLLEKGRGALGELNAADFYGEGCDSTSVFIVPGDEEDPEAVVDEEQEEITPFAEEQQHQSAYDEEQQQPVEEGCAPQADMADFDAADVDHIMGGNDRETKSAMLGPIEGPAASFELWESGSAKDEEASPASPTMSLAEGVSVMF